MMPETPYLIAAFFAGLALGAAFFGGLWWTVRKALPSSLAALWFSGSFLLRTAIAVCGFYLVSASDWRRLLCCMAGFLLMRMLVVRLTRVPAQLERAS